MYNLLVYFGNFLFFNKFIYLFLAVLGIHCCVGFSLAVEGRGLRFSFDVQASDCSVFSAGFSRCRALALESGAPAVAALDSVAVCAPSCLAACGILQD